MKDKPPYRVRYLGHELLVSGNRDPQFNMGCIGIHEAQVIGGSLPPMFVIFDRQAERVLEVPGKGKLIHARMVIEGLEEEVHALMMAGDCLAEDEHEAEARRERCTAEVLEKRYPPGPTKVAVELPLK